MADNLLEKASILLTPTAYNDGSMLSVKPENGDGDFTFSRGSAATRVNAQGLVENVQIISSELVSNGNFSQIGTEEVSNGNFSQEGSELITNGDFATDSDWVKQQAGRIGDGVAKVDNTSTDYISQDGIVSDTKTYAITFTILNYISGSIRLRLGNTYGDYVSGNGTYTKYIQCTTSNKFRVYSSPSGANLSIDNVSVKEVGQDWTLLNGSISDKYNASMTAYQSGIKITPFSKTGKYKAVFDLVVTSGSCKFDAGGGNDEIYTTSGTKEKLITNPTKFEFNAFNLGWVGTLDNISVKEITDDTDLPRIDYTDGCGSWLLEPQSTNLVTQSELFSDSSWAKSDVTAEGGFTSPSGDESAYKLKEGSATINHQMFGIISGTAGNIYTLSGIFKKGERDIIQLFMGLQLLMKVIYIVILIYLMVF